MRAMIAGGVLAAALLMGCGGVEPDVSEDVGVDVGVDEPSSGVSQQADYCNNERFTYTYYSDATYTTVVGIHSCRCWTFKRTSGYVTQYWILTGYGVCTGNPP